MRTLRLALFAAIATATLLASANVSADEPVDFEKQVLPLLEGRCFECHASTFKGRKKRPKGSFRIDGNEWLLKGGASGPAIVAGKPAISLLLARISLPDDHEDVMPPSGDVFDAEQAELIERWIREGAKFGSWRGTGGPPKGTPLPEPKPKTDGDRPDRNDVYRKLGAKLQPAPGAAIASVRAAGARVTPVIPGSRLLRVEFIQDPDAADDDAVKKLAALRRHVAVLSLDSSKISDKALLEIAKLSKLVRLDIQRTSITDAAVESLAKTPPPHLRRLNLYGTKITDKSIAALSRIRTLRSVFLWSTGVSSAGVQQLSSLLPECRVQAERTLAQPRARNDGDGNRRRRRNN
ncbi:MAG: hypothetical protein OER88_03470 [Planctomycetota bacterium]|nr:hypothetical protein [Planctomycetota bacterium]